MRRKRIIAVQAKGLQLRANGLWQSCQQPARGCEQKNNVMAGLVPASMDFRHHMDARNKSAHDDGGLAMQGDQFSE